jgi:hypothetical protein
MRHVGTRYVVTQLLMLEPGFILLLSMVKHAEQRKDKYKAFDCRTVSLDLTYHPIPRRKASSISLPFKAHVHVLIRSSLGRIHLPSSLLPF